MAVSERATAITVGAGVVEGTTAATTSGMAAGSLLAGGGAGSDGEGFGEIVSAVCVAAFAGVQCGAGQNAWNGACDVVKRAISTYPFPEESRRGPNAWTVGKPWIPPLHNKDTDRRRIRGLVAATASSRTTVDDRSRYLCIAPKFTNVDSTPTNNTTECYSVNSMGSVENAADRHLPASNADNTSETSFKFSPVKRGASAAPIPGAGAQVGPCARQWLSVWSLSRLLE